MENDQQSHPPKPSGLASFWAELKRRKVMRVAITYAVVAWLIMQVAGLTFEGFGVPIWAFRFVVIVLWLFFPVAIILTWAFELTPEGIKTTKNARESQSEEPVSKTHLRKRNWMALGFAAALPTVVFGALALFFYFRSGGDDEAALGEKSIAVIPLENLSTDPSHAYFANAIHNEILTNLANISDLVVIGRTSVLQYQDTVKTLQQIGEELGVRYLVEGSVFRDQNQASINIQLIDTKTRDHMWAQVYDRNTDKLMSIRAAVAKDVAEQLHAVLSPREATQIEELPTNNSEAYEHFLKGENEKAVELDPNFYKAWLGIAIGSAYNYRRSTNRQDPELLAKARQATEQLKAVDPTGANYLLALAVLVYNEANELQKSIEHLHNALSKDPQHAEVQSTLALRYIETGRIAEAIPLFESADRKEPLSTGGGPRRLFRLYQKFGQWELARSLVERKVPYSVNYWPRARHVVDYIESGNLESYIAGLEQLTTEGNREWLKVNIALLSRSYPKSIELLDASSVAQDNSNAFSLSMGDSTGWRFDFSIGPAHLVKALLWLEIDKPENARREANLAKSYLEKVLDLDPYADPSFHSSIAIAYAVAGDSESLVNEISKARELTKKPDWAYRRRVHCEMHIAIAYLTLGDKDNAIETLEAASKLESPMFFNRELDLWFIFDRLRGNPRFDALLEN